MGRKSGDSLTIPLDGIGFMCRPHVIQIAMVALRIIRAPMPLSALRFIGPGAWAEMIGPFGVDRPFSRCHS